MRDLVSVGRLIAELGERMNYTLLKVSHISKVWEYSTGTQNLENSKGPIMKSRTKNIGIKYYSFRLIIKPSEIEILCIESKDERVYIFTKGLTRFNFKYIHKRVMVW